MYIADKETERMRRRGKDKEEERRERC